MKKQNVFSALVAMIAFSAAAQAAVKTYQVTGPVLEVTPTTVTVQKGTEKWVIQRDASTATQGELKVGDKVTVMYSMAATSIEVKGGAPAAKSKKK